MSTIFVAAKAKFGRAPGAAKRSGLHLEAVSVVAAHRFAFVP
jgi:hypothetical protein